MKWVSSTQSGKTASKVRWWVRWLSSRQCWRIYRRTSLPSHSYNRSLQRYRAASLVFGIKYYADWQTRHSSAIWEMTRRESRHFKKMSCLQLHFIPHDIWRSSLHWHRLYAHNILEVDLEANSSDCQFFEIERFHKTIWMKSSIYTLFLPDALIWEELMR